MGCPSFFRKEKRLLLLRLSDLIPERVLNEVRVSKDERYADVSWQLDFNQADGGRAMTETMWRCNQLRAGQLYSRMMFDTKAEAEQFARRMREAEPDQMVSIEAVEARQVWN